MAALKRCRARGFPRQKVGPMSEPRKKKSWHDSVPFPRHWLAYVILKLAVVALAVYLVLRFMGQY
jgi:hypothetical protein